MIDHDQPPDIGLEPRGFWALALRAFLLALVLAAGIFLLLMVGATMGCCQGGPMRLDGRFRPLEVVEESRAVPVGVLRTRGSKAYTGSTCALDAAGEPARTGVLLHEALHSKRQFAFASTFWGNGVDGYLLRYAYDRGFCHDEEEAGWQVQIDYVIQHGGWVDEAATARFMDENYLVDGVSVFYPGEAVAWVHSAVAGARGQ